MQLNLFCLRCLGFSNPPPASYISSRKSFVQEYKILEIRNDSSLATKVELLGSIWWRWMKFFPSFCEGPKNPYWFLRHLLLLQVETLPYRHDILPWDSLSSRWIPVSEWVLGIRSLFLIILPNHLPQEISNSPSFLVIRTSFAFSLLGYFLMHLTFPILQSQQSDYLLPKFSSRTKHVLRRIPQIFVHFEISRLPGGLDHFVDSNSISKNLTTIYHPVGIALIQLMFLLLLVVKLVLQFRLSLIDEVYLFDDSLIILHNTCQIQINCTYE